ncbi:MAG TPA: dihydrodipicolinate synthase family protein [Opitutaceae bacterium]|nr:dihydrodipicolinate synthase family protein [Opitutaceae bacterium]HND63052.1 dihydrodipicolinate synthase family protein [Opitutaceae bacterium]
MKFASLQRDCVWSATPTPFLPDGRVDVPSVQRLVTHHLALGVSGVMLAGTCGEGPWMLDSDRDTLVRATVDAAQGRLGIAVQVTDNSARRVLHNIERAAAAGAQIAVVAAPSFFLNATPRRLVQHYVEVARQSVLPVGLYDRGKASPYVVPDELLPEILAEQKIIVVKDSAQQAARRAAYRKCRDARPGLLIYSGSEFDCPEVLADGYDGLLLGGAIFNGRLARAIVAAVRAGDLKRAQQIQDRMTDLMHRVYGGPAIECWMTGLKELLVQLGVFSSNHNLLGYPLTPQCLAQIRGAVSGSDGLGFRDDLLPARAGA